MSSNKRGNIFGQGKPERPYEERDNEPADVPQRATAAQLASRKIKTAKARRPAGASSGLSQSANFAAPQQSGFSFGASAPAPSENGTNGANNFGFGGNNAFAGAATNSFPPAQSATPSNTFTNSSFPAFGASSNQSSTFNPQPPSAGFNFTAGGSNPFASMGSAPTTNGTTPAPAFGGSSMFNAQPQSNAFGGLGQNTTSAAPPSTMFGTSSSTPSSNLFGAASSAPNTTSTPAPAAPTFSLGAPASSTQTSAGTAATTNAFGGFGTSTQTAAPAQNNIFGRFGASAQKSQATTEATAPQKNLFGSIGSSTQGAGSGAVTAPASSLFNFGTTAQKSDGTATTAPSTSMFGASSSATPSASTPASASVNNMFAKLPSAPSTTPFLFGAASTSQVQEVASTTSNNLFSSLKPVEQSSSAAAEAPKPNPFASLAKPTEAKNSTATETPKPNLFASLAKPNSTPTATPVASTPSFGLFGTSQNKELAAGSSEKAVNGATPKAPGAPGSGVFNVFNTPQPVKTSDVEKSQGGFFSAQPKTSSGIFSQTFQPEKTNTSLFQSAGQQAPATSKDPSKDATASQASSNPFSKLPASTSERPSIFAPQESAAASSTISMKSLTGNAQDTDVLSGSATGAQLPKIPKVHVPKEWAVPGVAHAQGAGSLAQQILDLTAQLQALNARYRQQMSTLPLTADWSSVSIWHYQHAVDIKKKIDLAKKQRANANGITGNESSLSKRKMNDESPAPRDSSPSKRARADAMPATSTPQLSGPAPKLDPPAATASNMFAKPSNDNSFMPAASSASTNLFAPKPVEKPTTELSNSAPPSTGFTPSLGASNNTTAAYSGFKPSFGAGATGGFTPTSEASSSGGGGFFAQFSKTAKTYEELAAERKAKAKEEDYDSDDESEEQWSARYDKEEAERIAEDKKKAAATPTFSIGSTKSSGSTTPPSNPFSGLLKPTSGTTTSGGFTPRGASPALSASGSVFDAASAAQTPSSNIFGHLSSAPSSNDQDESDEDEAEQATAGSRNDQPIASAEPTTPPKRKFGGSDDTAEDSTSRKKQETVAAPKGSLLSRITRDNDAESENENNSSASIFGQANGTQTPTNKPFSFFDFGAAGSKTAPPKTDTFAGDQTFKPGTPIKFGEAPATEKKNNAPVFQFQPATPSAAEMSTTPAKPPPTSLFNFGASSGGSSLLAPSAGMSGASSVPSSVFSSRAGTPLSEADTSAASAAEDEEEGGKQSQVDFSQLTEDETNDNDIIFHAEMVLAKHQADKGDGTKTWANLAKGPLWILKDKTTAKCFVRVRLANGSTPINYQILPALKATVTGGSKKMVMASKPAQGGGFQQVLYAVRSSEVAEEFATKYNDSLPSN